MSGGLEIELRLNGNRIGESDVSSLKRETGPVESGLAFEDVDAAKDGGACHGAAEAEIGVTGEPAIAVRIWSSGAVCTWISSLMLLSGELETVRPAPWRPRSR